MPRRAREQSPTDFYHIMIRGINKEKIFEKSKHKKFMIEILSQSIEELQVDIGAYCIMDNHMHLIMKGDLFEIAKLMKKINIRFAMRYNNNLDRVGHVFQDRYRSENIYNDNHLLNAVSYIHNNPVKAGISKEIQDYEWSSYLGYFTKTNLNISDKIKDMVIELAGGVGGLREFHEKENITVFIDTEEEVKIIKDEIFNRTISGFCQKEGIRDASQIKRDPEKIDNLIKILLGQDAFTYREIAEVLEVNKNYVYKVSIDN
ncbi:MAG: transposase [Gudongella sp.]|nr:transposase [Gudongella sp.]